MSAICRSIGLVELGVDPEALDLERRARRRCRCRPCRSGRRGRAAACGRLERIGPTGCSRRRSAARSPPARRRAGRDRRRRRASAGRAVRVVVGRPGRVRGVDRRSATARMPRPSDVPRSGPSRSIAAIDRGPVVGRDLDREAAVAERDDADPDRWRLALDERAGGGLGRLHPGRRDVGRRPCCPRRRRRG